MEMKSRKLFVAPILIALPVHAFAETCYRIAKTEAFLRDAKELLCVTQGESPTAPARITLGVEGQKDPILTLQLPLLMRASCGGTCNSDEYGYSWDSSQVVNDLSISFDGERDPGTGREQGTVMIGANRYFYLAR
jgi:hypothetical protein